MSEDTITALAIRRGNLEWTTLHRKKGKVEVAGQQRVHCQFCRYVGVPPKGRC